MKLTIPTKSFREAIARLSNIPGSIGANPHTQAVRFEADMAGLILTRFTSEAKISVTLDNAEISDESGSFSVDHTSLTALISRLPGQSMTLSNDEKSLFVESGRGKGRLFIFSEEVTVEPPVEEMKAEHIRIAIEELRPLFAFAALASSRDVTARPQFCGVCIRMMGEKLCFIGTDTKRCHVASVEYKLPVDCIVASGGVEALLKVIHGEGGACTLSIGDNTLSVRGNNTEVVLTLMVERFPNITQLLNQPESSIQSKVTVNRDELIEALKDCATVGRGDARFVTWEFAKKALRLTAWNERDSQKEYTLECVATESAKIGVPSLQLVTALENMKADEGGNIELLYYLGSLYVKQIDKTAFVALSAKSD